MQMKGRISMQIDKISDDEIRCTLSGEDLKAGKIDIKSLAYGTRDEKELISRILAEAEHSCGFYIRDGDRYKAEIIPLAGGSLEVDVNYRPSVIPAGNVGKTDAVSGLSAALHSLLHEAGEEDGGDSAGGAAGEETSGKEEADSMDQNRNDSVRDFVRLNRMFVFPSISKAHEAAAAIPGFSGDSALYQSSEDGSYHLILTMKDRKAIEDEQKSLITLSEYATQEVVTPSKLQSLSEHGTLLIPEHAVEKLAQI
jgi:adapter protein MecA 1/2